MAVFAKSRGVSIFAIMRRTIVSGWMFFLVLGGYLLWLFQRKVRKKEKTDAFIERHHERSAKRLRRGFENLEGVYIKIGQFISMMTGFLPDAYLVELEGMQDAVPPHDYPPIRDRVETELETEIGGVYNSFSEEPVASASLGQVHFATLLDGTEAAVKVQYPGIERIVEADLRMIGIVLRVLGWFLPGLQGPTMHKEISGIVRGELEYRREGKNAERICANFAGNEQVAFPEIIWDHTTDKVLTMHRCYGHKITNVEALVADGIDPTGVIKTLVQAYFKQILIDGVFHADPHPGNFFVSRQAANDKHLLTFLDFGAVSDLPDEIREGMRTVVYGYMTEDNAKVLNGMREMGFESSGADEEVFEKAVRHYLDKLLHLDIEDFSAINLQQFDVNESLTEMELSFRELTKSFEVPEAWFHVQRTLALLLGLCARLDPAVDAFRFGFPYAVEFVFGGDSKLASVWGTTSDPVIKNPNTKSSASSNDSSD